MTDSIINIYLDLNKRSKEIKGSPMNKLKALYKTFSIMRTLLYSQTFRPEFEVLRSKFQTEEQKTDSYNFLPTVFH